MEAKARGAVNAVRRRALPRDRLGRLCLGELAQLFLLLVGPDQTRRHNQLGGVLDREIERDHLARRHEHDEAGGRIGTVRHEYCDQRIVAADLLLNLLRRIAGEKHQRIETAAGKLDEPDALERGPALGEDRREDCLISR